jgi:hypothetical protein
MDRQDEIQLLCKIFEKKKGERSNWDDQWERLSFYLLPGKADFGTERPVGDPTRHSLLYDSTAMVANHTLASHMHMALTSPAAPWFEIMFREHEMNRDDKAKEWLEECNNRMFHAINESNFVSAINELYQDMIAYGTGCLETGFIMEPNFRLSFRDYTMGQLVFLEDVNGRVDTVFHEQKLSARQAKQKWPDTPIDKVDQMLENNPEEMITFLRICRPNPNHDPQADLNPEAAPVEDTWVCNKIEIETTYTWELPFQVPRWSKMTSEPYGYGPGMQAYPEVMTLNEAKRLELRSWEKAIDPPMAQTANGVIGDLHIEAGGLTTVRDMRGLAPLQDAANWSATQIKSEEARKSIQTIYLIDQLILPERPNATATEVQIRYQMMQRVLGPTAGRLTAELLDPLVRRIFGLMFRNGQFPEMPQEVGDSSVDIKYTGPLSRAQTQDDARAIERMYTVAQSVPDTPLSRAILLTVDEKKAAMLLAEQYGVPAKVTRSEREMKQLEEQMMEQARQQQAMMQQAAAAEMENTQADTQQKLEAVQ